MATQPTDKQNARDALTLSLIVHYDTPAQRAVSTVLDRPANREAAINRARHRLGNVPLTFLHHVDQSTEPIPA